MKLKPIRRSLGALLIADGIRAFVAPKTYARKLETGTPLIDDLLEAFAENPRLTRSFSIAELTVGLWLVFG